MVGGDGGGNFLVQDHGGFGLGNQEWAGRDLEPWWSTVVGNGGGDLLVQGHGIFHMGIRTSLIKMQTNGSSRMSDDGDVGYLLLQDHSVFCLDR